MIRVTRLDGSAVLLNIDQIESIEETPDTVVSLTNGHKILTRESPQELVERVIAFRRLIASGATSEASATVGEAPHLGPWRNRS